MDSIQIASLNCRGLASREKRGEVFQFLKLKKFNICCLQDTHFVNMDKEKLRKEWGNECFFSCKSSNSRGVAILFGAGTAVNVLRSIEDNEGNFVILHIKLNDYDITLVSLYGPNIDSPEFYSELERYVLDFDNPFNIICGDWNLVQNFDYDTYNYVRINNPQGRNRVMQLKNNLNLIDPWRELYPSEKCFTWRQPNPVKMARLDFFLFTKEMMSCMEKVDISPGFRSDHSLVSIHLNLSKIDRGRGYWKFNNALLKDEQYTQKIKLLIKETIKMYSGNEFNIDVTNFETHDFENHRFTINDQLLFDTLLLVIRGETISYSSMKKRKSIETEKRIENEIIQLERQISLNQDEQNNLEQLEIKKAYLEEIRKQKIDDAILRSKLKWMEFGEKPSKFFLNLEKQNGVNKQIRKLVDDTGNIITDQNILPEIHKFYSNLYKNRPTKAYDWEDLANANVPKLDSQKQESIEGPLSIDEVYEVIKQLKTSKSPGMDGFTAEFIKYFWSYLKYFMIRSFNYAYNNGHMTTSQKSGIITLIPKGNKDRQYLKNWRPISLLNVFYKITTACIANRIKRILSILIHESQKGFMSGRFIGENIRLLYDILLYTDINDIPGLLLLIDFEKAFDSISHDFIMQVLHFFNFGNSIKTWVRLFYEDAYSCVLVNGHLTNRFKIERGCRQGDPLSPYIFLLCAEILSISIRNNNLINGLLIRNVSHKIIQYADDTIITLDGSNNDLKETMQILDAFANVSGLAINKQKTKAIWIGKNKNKRGSLCAQENLEWVYEGYFRYLGIDFAHDLDEMIQHNYNEKIMQIKSQMTLWLKRSLTVLGRITVVKSLLVSKLNYLFMSLPNPSDLVMRDIDRLFHNFIWENKPDKINREQMSQPYCDGGAKMINIYIHAKSLKISWMRRLFKDTIDSNMSELMNTFLPDTLQFKTSFGDDHFVQMASSTTNPFWKDVFLAYSSLQSVTCMNTPCQPLWKNSLICIDNKSILYNSWYKNGIMFINDLLNDDGGFLTFDTFKLKWEVNVNFLQYFGMCEAIKCGYNRPMDLFKIDQPLRPDTISLVCKFNKGCSHIYTHLLNYKKRKKCKSLYKWKAHFDIDDRLWQTYCLHAFNCTMDVGLRWFQYKIVHRILFTNDLLFKLNLVHDRNCSFCNLQHETIVHFFCECHISLRIWDELRKWILRKTFNRINFSKENILFGFQGSQNKALNCIVFIAKKTLYSNKFQNRVPYFLQFRSAITDYYRNEEYIAILKGNHMYNSFRKKWFGLDKMFVP